MSSKYARWTEPGPRRRAARHTRCVRRSAPATIGIQTATGRTPIMNRYDNGWKRSGDRHMRRMGRHQGSEPPVYCGPRKMQGNWIPLPMCRVGRSLNQNIRWAPCNFFRLFCAGRTCSPKSVKVPWFQGVGSKSFLPITNTAGGKSWSSIGARGADHYGDRGRRGSRMTPSGCRANGRT